MKKLVAFLCVVAMCFSQSVFAQKPHSDLHHEIGVNIGPCSVVGGFINGSIGFWSALGGTLSHKPIDMKWCGQYSLHYYYQVKPWCQIGLKTTVECAKLIHYTDTFRTTVTAIDHDILFAVMPSVRFTYLNRPWVRLYSGLDVGCGFMFSTTSATESKEGNDDNNRNYNVLPAFNVTVLGVNVGKKFYGLFELNAGYDAIVKAGIGARF